LSYAGDKGVSLPVLT